jgi:protein SCO1
MAQPVLAHPDERPASQEGDEEILAPPPTYKAANVNVDEKLGAKLAVDAKFRDQDGKLVTLGDVLHGAQGEDGAGELPTILTFNYSDCPMLCSLQLNGLSKVLPAIAEKQDAAMFRIGGQYRIVTIDLEPNESLEKVTKMREKYIERLPENQRALARKGWTFLIAETKGDGAAIRRVADSVGFSYTYLPDRAEYAHPAALIFVSVKGTVTRYVYGIEFEPSVMRDSLFKAGAAEPSSAVGFMNRCYHFDPDANNHSREGVLALRVGAAGFVVLLLAGLGMIHVIRRSKPGIKNELSPPRGKEA